jgi:L-ribulokinase
MLNADQEKHIPGVAGVVEEGILPGYYGYETGQAAVGDAFDWLRQTVGQTSFANLAEGAKALPPGAEGVLCIDWLNGCRTPLMDGSLTGAFTGLTLNHGPQHLYRALLEASAYGLRWIVDILKQHGLPVNRFVATGGLPHSNPFLVRIYADVLGQSIKVAPPEHGPALGAAILGVLAAGGKKSGFRSATHAIQTMTRTAGNKKSQNQMVRPKRTAARAYDGLYLQYLDLGKTLRKRK